MKIGIVGGEKNRKIYFNGFWSTNTQSGDGLGLVRVYNNDVTFDNKDNKSGIDVFFNLTTYDGSVDNTPAITIGETKKVCVTINGGIYASLGRSCISIQNDSICIINDGIFATQPSSKCLVDEKTSPEEYAKYGKYRNFLLQREYKNDDKMVNFLVRGGYFLGFDPADNYSDGGKNTNFVCKGYKSVLNGTYTYRVKDSNSIYNNQLVTVPVYRVVAKDDINYLDVYGIDGIVDYNI
jgi:hypothetical protein